MFLDLNFKVIGNIDILISRKVFKFYNDLYISFKPLASVTLEARSLEELLSLVVQQVPILFFK